jgi:pimeloyl-ACP methyl ester carboxylesterase
MAGWDQLMDKAEGLAREQSMRHRLAIGQSGIHQWAALLAIFFSGLGLLTSGGCSLCKCGSVWIGRDRVPCLTPPRAGLCTVLARDLSTLTTWQLATLKYDRGDKLALLDAPACVDEYYDAARLAWLAAGENGELVSAACPDSRPGRALQLYADSLRRLVCEGHRLGRFDAARGLRLIRDGAEWTLPVCLDGFAWQPEDFQDWHAVGTYCQKSLSQEYRQPGVGVSLVAVRRNSTANGCSERDFLPPASAIGVTAVLDPDEECLRLVNPLVCDSVELAGCRLPMARDLTASLAFGLHHAENDVWENFFFPNRPEAAGQLTMTEPYQPGKIPVIFIHGLISSRTVWAEVFNELRAKPELLERYQIWSFQYSTGAPFIRSAGELRAQLTALAEHYDPQASDPALRRTVLVGHSMGGLIARLLTAYSGEDVWNEVANLPLEMVATNERTRGRLAEQLYFDPHPLVDRVVMIAAPHQGSAVAGRALGQLGNALIDQDNPELEQLLADNQGGFKFDGRGKLPTSIDLLDPDQPFLRVLSGLPVSPEVHYHSIIGTGRHLVLEGWTDGIVRIESARMRGVESEQLVPATHTSIVRDRRTVTELERILWLHGAE